MPELYPEISPYNSGFMPVSGGHLIYWEESGNPKGAPVVFLHGGPGSGCRPSHRQFFNRAAYRIILMDQRGSGKSTPHAELTENTTWHLVDDLEQLRKQLGVDQWIVFGGSWGSTLALAYATAHPKQVSGLILRGIFLGRQLDLDWFFKNGARYVYPDAWEAFIQPISQSSPETIIQDYYRQLTSSDPKTRQKAAKAWAAWESNALSLLPYNAAYNDFTEEVQADALARIECHYFMNDCFFDSDNYLIDRVPAIQHIKGIIIHGRYDMICPLQNAWELHKAWPNSKLQIIPAAGHAAFEKGIIDALVAATDEMSKDFI